MGELGCKHVVAWVLLFIILIIIFCLSFKNQNPKCYISDLYVPALNTRIQYPHDPFLLFFDIMLDNVMPYNGLKYDMLNLTFSYSNDGRDMMIRSRTDPLQIVAQHSLPGFYQGMSKTAHKRDVVTNNGRAWDDGRGNLNGSVLFRVDLVTNVRSKQYFWYARKHRLVVGGTVVVGSAGTMEHKGDVRLR